MRPAQRVGMSRKYQVSGQVASPATVMTACPAGTRGRAFGTTSRARVRSQVVWT